MFKMSYRRTTPALTLYMLYHARHLPPHHTHREGILHRMCLYLFAYPVNLVSHSRVICCTARVQSTRALVVVDIGFPGWKRNPICRETYRWQKRALRNPYSIHCRRLTNVLWVDLSMNSCRPPRLKCKKRSRVQPFHSYSFTPTFKKLSCQPLALFYDCESTSRSLVARSA